MMNGSRMDMNGTAGYRHHGKRSNHHHCFCKTDTGGNITCCRCGMMINSCDNCGAKYCQHRETLRQHFEGNPILAWDCPLASPKYSVIYRRTPV